MYASNLNTNIHITKYIFGYILVTIRPHIYVKWREIIFIFLYCK